MRSAENPDSIDMREDMMESEEAPSFEELMSRKRQGMQKQIQSEAMIRAKLLQTREWAKVQTCLKGYYIYDFYNYIFIFIFM